MEQAFKGRKAFIHSVRDCYLPAHYRKGWIERTGVEWIAKDIDARDATCTSKGKEAVGLRCVSQGGRQRCGIGSEKASGV